MLRAFIDQLPEEYSFAVELRHFSWFDEGANERAVDAMLSERGVDKVLFDSRALYHLPADDEHERSSQSRKPKTPYRETVTGQSPLVRIVGRNRVSLADGYLTAWAKVIAGWLHKDLKPYIFTHAPNDAFAPAMAKLLLEKIRIGFPGLPAIPEPTIAPCQQNLFD